MSAFNTVEELVKVGDWLVGYVCDIEGNLAFWDKYLQISKVVKRGTDGLEFHNNHCMLVVGGDICDRGNGDLRILEDLIALKRKYKAENRVHFILGNRDVNKLRLPVTLCDAVLAHRPECYWVDSAKTVDASYRVDNPADKMKWCLKHTMGSPFSFECRRQEMTEKGFELTDEAIVHDYLHLILPGGTLFEYCKEGCMAVVIGDVMFVHGAITTYNHNKVGFVPPTYLRTGVASGEPKSIPQEHLSSCLQWVTNINDFARLEMVDYENNIVEYLKFLETKKTWEELRPFLWDSMGGYDSPQPGSRLIQCGMGNLPNKDPNPGVIYAAYLVNGKPNHLEESVAQWLKDAHVTKVVVGHQPNADVALIMTDFGVTTVSNDSSYSKNVMWSAPDLKVFAAHNYAHLAEKVDENSTEWLNVDQFKTKVLSCPPASTALPSEQADTRNEYTVNEVLNVFPAHKPRVHVMERVDKHEAANVDPSTLLTHGRCSINLTYQSAVNQFIGKELDGWMVKAQGLNVHGEEYYLLSQSEGFNFKNKLMRKADVEK